MLKNTEDGEFAKSRKKEVGERAKPQVETGLEACRMSPSCHYRQTYEIDNLILPNRLDH